MIAPRFLLLCTLLASALPVSAATTAIINATIFTADKAGVITNGTLVIRDRRIVSVGMGTTPPPGATIIDGRGKTLTPGMFAPLSSLGVSEIDGVGETNDSGSGHRRYSASIDMADAFNPLSLRIPIARVDGVTRAMVSPLRSTVRCSARWPIWPRVGSDRVRTRWPTCVDWRRMADHAVR